MQQVDLYVLKSPCFLHEFHNVRVFVLNLVWVIFVIHYFLKIALVHKRSKK